MELHNHRRSFLAALISSFLACRASGQDAQTDKTYTLRKFTSPFYPPLARQTGIEGKAAAVAHIAPDGSVSAVTDYDGHGIFQSAVVDALKDWQFQNMDGQEGQIRITFQFAFKGVRDQRVLHFKVSANLPSYFEIEVNPAPNTYS